MFVEYGFGNVGSGTVWTFEGTLTGMCEFMSFHLHVSKMTFTALFARIFVTFFMDTTVEKMTLNLTFHFINRVTC